MIGIIHIVMLMHVTSQGRQLWMLRWLMDTTSRNRISNNSSFAIWSYFIVCESISFGESQLLDQQLNLHCIHLGKLEVYVSIICGYCRNHYSTNSSTLVRLHYWSVIHHPRHKLYLHRACEQLKSKIKVFFYHQIVEK